jgi:hypothetical protein
MLHRTGVVPCSATPSAVAVEMDPESLASTTYVLSRDATFYQTRLTRERQSVRYFNGGGKFDNCHFDGEVNEVAGPNVGWVNFTCHGVEHKGFANCNYTGVFEHKGFSLTLVQVPQQPVRQG